jgi:hypothetical protein
MAQPSPTPLAVPWEMKPVESAERTEQELNDGRVRYAVRHEPIAGVTPRMLLWWFDNMAGNVEVGGRVIPRFRAWHPTDHVRMNYVTRGRNDHRMGPGSKFRTLEDRGQDARYRVDLVAEVQRLDEGGLTYVGRWFGVEVSRLECTFDATYRGTLVTSILTVGGPFGALGRTVIPRVFSRSRGLAWQRHHVEEVGNWQFFLPKLFRDETGSAG